MPCSPGPRAAATADFGALARSCPLNSMAPVLAIADLVADRLSSTPIVTPLERLRHPSQPGRSWSYSREEHQYGHSTFLTVESQATPRADAPPAIRGSGT